MFNIKCITVLYFCLNDYSIKLLKMLTTRAEHTIDPHLTMLPLMRNF